MAAQKERLTLKVCMFGGGSFGTAVGTVIARNGHSVCILDRREHRAKAINETHHNPDYLKEYSLPDNLTCTTDPSTALEGVDVIVHSIPVQSSPAFLSDLKALIPPNVPIVSLSKGVHLETLKFMNEVIEEALGRKQPSAFLSGPSFARELMDKQPTGLVVASADIEISRMVQILLVSKTTKVWMTSDVIGVEVGGALKNIFAIGAGCAQGLGYNLNTAALLVTRGCHEMNRLALAIGARPGTLGGLSGIGDLMLTCFGPASRNRSVGVRLGQGEKLEDIVKSMSEVAEGVVSTFAAVKLGEKYGLDLPMIQTMAAVLEGKLPAREGLELLMTREANDELAGLAEQ